MLDALLLDFFHAVRGFESSGAAIRAAETISNYLEIDDADYGNNNDQILQYFQETLGKEFENSPSCDYIDDYCQSVLKAVQNSLYCLKGSQDRVILSMKQRLQLLCNLLNMNYERERIQYLAGCNGCGLMLALYAANEKSASGGVSVRKKSLTQVLPPNVCQMDVQGSITVIEKYALIRVGEIKTSYSGTKKEKLQISVRANLIKWAIMILCEVVKDLALQGHIFMSKEASQSQSSACNA